MPEPSEEEGDPETAVVSVLEPTVVVKVELPDTTVDTTGVVITVELSATGVPLIPDMVVTPSTVDTTPPEVTVLVNELVVMAVCAPPPPVV